MIVINLFGAPGAGKSTGAAYIFVALKTLGVNVELITEFAKDKVWENNIEAINNQAYIFGEQSFRMSRCKDKVDVIITDSPLLLSAIYNKDKILGEDFNRVVKNVFQSYDNRNYYIERNKRYYQSSGRIHSKKESDEINSQLKKLLKDYNIEIKETILGMSEGYKIIVNDIVEELGIKYD